MPSSSSSSSMAGVGALDKELSKSTVGSSGIPIGFSFHPSERDLVIHYLFKKVKGIPLPSDSTIPFCDLYGQQEPWEIWDAFGGNIDDGGLLFFTNRKQISPNPSRNLKKMKRSAPRAHRQVGSSAGTWHDEGRNKQCEWLGIQWLVKIFTYENPKSSAQNGAWMMHEYSLLPNDNLVSTPTATVICRLRKKNPKRKRQLDGEDRSDDDDADKNRKRCKADQQSISATVAAVVVNPPPPLLELEQEAATNNEHLLCEPEDQQQYDDYRLLIDDSYSFDPDDILSTEPSNFDDEPIDDAPQQHQAVDMGEEMGLDDDEDDDMHAVIQNFLREELAPTLLQENSSY